MNGSVLAITVTNFFATVPAPVNITSASATSLAVGRLGATTPAFTVDSSTASQVAGLKVTGAVTGGTVAVVTTDSGADTSLTVNAKGTGTIGIGSVSTGRVTITPVTTITGLLTLTAGVTGALTVTTSSASGLAVGLAGATNPAFVVDASTGSQAAGFKIVGAVTGGTVALVAIDSGADTNVTLNAKGTGTIGIGSVSTGRVTITPVTTITGSLTLSAALVYGGVTLSNAVTGTGNMVLSASPTLTGTLTAATGTFSAVLSTASSLAIAATQKLYLDGVAATGDTYIHESSANNVIHVVGGANALTLTATTATFVAGVVVAGAVSGISTLATTSTVGIGTAAVASTALLVSLTTATSTAQVGVSVATTVSSASTTSATSIDAQVRTAAGSYTVTNAYAFYANGINRGAGSLVTNNYGLYINNQGDGGVTTAYGIYVAATSGAGTNYGLYVAGGPNVLTGALSGITTLAYTTSLKSNTNFAGSVSSATEVMLHASTVSGGILQGFGTTNDVSIQNRAGNIAIGVTANTLNVVFAGAVSGISTLAGTGAVSGFTTAAFAGKISTTVTTEQLRLNYDSLNYMAVTVAADGTTTFDSVDDGSTGAFVFSDATTFSSDVTVSAGGAVTLSETNVSLSARGAVVLEATKGLYFDGSSGSPGNTYISEVSSDTLRITAGGNARIDVTATGVSFTAVTLTTVSPIVDYTGTWNAAQQMLGVQLNITDTSSNSNSRAIQVNVGASEVFYVNKDGSLGIGGGASTSTALLTPAGTTALSSLRLPHGSAPTSPVNGDVWTTTAGLFVRVNGATVGPLVA